MPKEIVWSSFEEKLAEHGRDLDDLVHKQLLTSLEKCYSWSHDYLRGQPVARLENQIREKMQLTLEKSMTNRVEEALEKFENLLLQ